MKSTKHRSAATATSLENRGGAEQDLGEAAPFPAPGSRKASPPEIAAYIAEMGASLRALARASDLKVLAYLLDVATAEATDQARAKSAKAR